MNRCATCRWWEQHSNGHEGFCRTDPSMSHMAKIAIRPGSPSVWAKHDEVRTRASFGCTEWEGKPETAK